MSDFKETLVNAALHGNSLIGFNCRVSKSYPARKCKSICKPIEGSFVTECEVKGCKNFE